MSSPYDRLKRRERHRFDAALETIFTPWQVQILIKLSEEMSLSDAERQELSRRIKPKILAIDTLRNVKLLHPFFK
jgi:hypothetical protein